MKNIDVALIHRVLDGDNTAFTELVNKYQKPVHALVWRKVGDFHIAEEITQDTFLKAYQRLATLKKPQRFASWLYVIAANHCSTWLRKKRLRTQSLEETSSAQLEKATYSGYIIEENERTAVETRREAVKKLLAKLQESERTVITLYYFGEMSSVEISAFLGVSENTIRSRLRRAQQRLKKEEPMIREALDNFQITPQFTENIMREISRLKPEISPSGKPFVPWAIAASTIALVFIMLGASNQYLSRFQKPYSFDAASEMTVELIEAPVILNLASKPDVQNQLGRRDATGRNENTHRKSDATLFPSASGRILDETGKPVSEIKIAVRPVVDGNGAWFVARGGNQPIEGASPFHAESDAAGRFAITSAIDGPVLLSLFPSHKSDIRILKVKIGGLSLYPTGMRERGVVFATSLGRRIENIEVIVQQPHIRGKVQYIDGTSIVNASIRLRLRSESLHGNSSSSDGGIQTDAEGYFTYYVDRDLGGPTFYMLSLVYQGQTVSAKPILLKPGDQTHDVVFTFETTPERPLRARHPRFARASASTTSFRAHNVWVVSAENGHAYKRIRCEDWKDAQAQATAEGAYLVTINDETEQKWLQAVFGGEPSWIGLNDIAQEGEWIWDNGEPLTYTNWGLQEPGDTSIGEEDYVIIGPSGKWEDFGPGHGGISPIRIALIEKENLPVKQ